MVHLGALLVGERHWVVPGVDVDVCPVPGSGGVRRRPPPQPGGVVPRPEVVQARAIVILLTGEAVPLGGFDVAAHRLVGAAAERVVLLITYGPRVPVLFQGCRTHVVVELIAEELLRGAVRRGRKSAPDSPRRGSRIRSRTRW